MKVESNNLGVLLKTIWIGLALVTIYCLFMITFTYMLFESLISKQFNIWNLLIPNLISIGIIFIYTKELLIGYNPTSKKKNLKSLIIFYLLITTLFLIQFPQLKKSLNNFESALWQLKITLIILSISYVGVIINRIIKLR